MEYCKTRDTLICGEIGSIRILNIKRGAEFRKDHFTITEAIYINVGEDFWVTRLYLDENSRIYAGCGETLHIYKAETGEKIESFYNIHELAITAIIVYEPSGYLITGAKDGSIKIWNTRKSLLINFHEHLNAITGFILMETLCETDKGTLPLLISSSLDATIRLWNFESFQPLYR